MPEKWSFSCGSVTHWNDFNVYQIIGIGECEFKCINKSTYLPLGKEYIVKSKEKCFYVKDNSFYEAKDVKVEFGERINDKMELKVQFDFIKHLGEAPKDRIVVFADSDFCFYAICEDAFEERKTFKPLSKHLHDKVKYYDFNKKTYSEYLNLYHSKIENLTAKLNLPC